MELKVEAEEAPYHTWISEVDKENQLNTGVQIARLIWEGKWDISH